MNERSERAGKPRSAAQARPPAARTPSSAATRPARRPARSEPPRSAPRPPRPARRACALRRPPAARRLVGAPGRRGPAAGTSWGRVRTPGPRSPSLAPREASLSCPVLPCRCTGWETEAHRSDGVPKVTRPGKKGTRAEPGDPGFTGLGSGNRRCDPLPHSQKLRGLA